MSDDKPKSDLSYLDAMHGVQTGVEYTMRRDPKLVEPKHLRVGVDSCQVNDAALVRLLIEKGLITAEEFAEALRLEANRELDRYEAKVAEIYGAKATLR